MVGFVVGADFPSTVKIMKCGDLEIEVGDIFKVKSGPKSYLVRVYDVEHFKPVNESILRGLALGREDVKAVVESMGETRVFASVILCEVSESQGKRFFRAPKSIPDMYSEVHEASDEDFWFIEEIGQLDIPLGTLRVRGGSRREVKLSSSQFPTHIGVYAVTGKGKTNAVLVILHSLMKNLPRGSVGVLVLDAHNEYFEGSAKIKGLKHLANLHDFKGRVFYYDFKKKGVLKPPKLSLPGMRVKEINDVIQLTDAQIEALLSYIQAFGHGKWLEKMEEDRESIKAEGKLVHGGKLGVAPNTFNALYRKINLIRGCESIVSTHYIKSDLSKDVIEKIDEGFVVIINLSNLTDLEERLIVNILTSRILDYRAYIQSRKPAELASKPYCLIILEEAHKVLGETVLRRGENVFSRVVREGRKFKAGLVAVAQMPRLIDPVIASQIQTNIILGLSHKLDRKAVEENSTQDLSIYDGEIQVLERGEALVSYPSEIAFPLPVKIYDFNAIVEEELRRGLKVSKLSGEVDVMI